MFITVGVQFVIDSGMIRMLMLPVDSLAMITDLLLLVHILGRYQVTSS